MLVASVAVHVEATTTGPLGTDADTIAIGVCEGERIAHDVPGGVLGVLLDAGEARTTRKAVAVAHAEDRRWLIVGLGPRGELDGETARVAAAVAAARAAELGTRTLCWELPHHVGDDVAAGLVEGTLLHSYRFERYKRAAADEPRTLERLIISAHHDVSAPVDEAAVIVAAQNRARELGNRPANDLTPETLAAYALALGGRHEALSVTVHDGAWIREAGMGAFAAVGQGSEQDQRLIILRYDGGGQPAGAPPALIGKAVTFDAGGLAIKPAPTMPEMKFDMGGGAAVIETLAALAELRAPVQVLGIVGATENMISGRAVKPGDIVRALDGTTIEINNPDAEGRLVLADCLTYAKRQGCAPLVDIATLTGGVVAALGSTYAGLFSNDDELASVVQRSAERTGELVWRLPLHSSYARMTEGRYADLTNRPEPREALASTAAELLHHFAGDTPWAHLDIAGTADDVRSEYLTGKGATGFGVRLLVDLVRSLSAPE
jgi:leucyl aminopeptidase